ncbi:uncharacterized protein LOC117170593 [Belonocnema kinseyi]|uniref:uncharacterized protein LOC117170593 n=1 Tax=Belonocnema kinseyi TaxID=2817044 RepID=UPI00143D57C1|nr:uncharacterized protein LOC117170593 [Belonocnema kinseyi]
MEDLFKISFNATEIPLNRALSSQDFDEWVVAMADKKEKKARIIAKGYYQVHRRDFQNTNAPVACFSSIRTTIAYVTQGKMHIHHYDVETSYLNGNIEETVIMEVPNGTYRH